MRAMIFAAGLGTRLNEKTKNKPKALVEIAGKTLLEHSIVYLKNYGITEIVINVHHFADQIIDFLKEKNEFGININISDERDLLLDTGGGLKKAACFFQGPEPIVLYNVDIFSNVNLQDLYSYHQQEGALATLVVRKRDTSRYLLFDDEKQLVGWKNIQTGEIKVSRANRIENADQLAFSGIHIVNPEIFNLISESGKFSIIDLYLRLSQVHTVKAYVDESEFWLDLGKASQFAEAEKMIKAFLCKKD